MENREAIAVIASFDSKGNIAPLWLRIAGYKFKVESYVIKKAQMGIYTFVCSIIDNDIQKEVVIYFNARDGLWYNIIKDRRGYLK